MNEDLTHKIHDQIFSLFESISPINDDLKYIIITQSDIIKVKKKEKLLKIGQISKSIYFVYTGAIRSFHLNPKGDEVTSWLLFENEIAISVFSFFSQKPSFEEIEALEDCVLLRLNIDKLQQLYVDFPSFNYIGRILTEQYYIRSEEKAISLRTLTAKERYNQLLKKRPDIFKRVSLGHIASYLGITQHTLSRLRT